MGQEREPAWVFPPLPSFSFSSLPSLMGSLYFPDSLSLTCSVGLLCTAETQHFWQASSRVVFSLLFPLSSPLPPFHPALCRPYVHNNPHNVRHSCLEALCPRSSFCVGFFTFILFNNICLHASSISSYCLIYKRRNSQEKLTLFSLTVFSVFWRYVFELCVSPVTSLIWVNILQFLILL